MSRPTISTLLPRFTFVLLSIFVLANGISAQAAPSIQWSVANPFRFIRDQRAMDEIIAANDRIKAVNGGRSSASQLEEELQRIDLETFQPLGWFSELAKNYHEKTCWDSRNLRFRNDGVCKDYIHPKFHRIRFWLADLAEPRNKRCEWFIEGKLLELKFCDEPVVYDKLEYDRGPKTVSVKIQGTGIRLSRGDVEVKDKLIVGLGDSYGSGEGNPDLPARFIDERTDTDTTLLSSTGLPTPKKDADGAAGWLDRRCHRSMYSYQFKTALQIALSDPYSAVTFVSYSCSAALIENITDVDQTDLKEHQRKNIAHLDKDNAYKRVPVQLRALKQVLCPGREDCTEDKNERGRKKSRLREIDYLLLSIGGNDVYFSKFVANIAIKGGSGLGLLAKITGKRKKPEPGTKTIVDELSRKYPELKKILVEQLKIKDCAPGRPCPRILLTTYPDALYDESGNFCTGERGEFDIPFGRDKDGVRAEKIRQTSLFLTQPLRQVQLDSRLGSGWTVVTDHLGAYLRHGFCARRSSESSTADLLTIPVMNGSIWQSYDRVDNRWRTFDPHDYHGYEKRERWFRLPVDAKLNIAQDKLIWKFNTDLFFVDELAGIMHPTAQGLAVTADANVAKISDIERGSH